MDNEKDLSHTSNNTPTQVITVIHEWTSVLKIHGQFNVIFLDFAEAFDTERVTKGSSLRQNFTVYLGN